DRGRIQRIFSETVSTGVGQRAEYRFVLKDGTVRFIESQGSVIRDRDGRVSSVLLVSRDITERQEAERERRLLEMQLRHAQKLESIGQLAAGIAHEINTPTQYIGDNTRFVQEAFADLSKLMRQYEKLLQAAKENEVTAELVAQVESAAVEADVTYLSEEIPKA